MSRSRLVWIFSLILSVALSSGVSLAGGVPEFHAYLLPPTSLAQVGDTVHVTFEVDATAVQFNAYEIDIQFDPDLISFLSVAQGPLMLAACASNFTNWSSTDSTVSYSHSLLCGVPSIDGPGILSIFDFRVEAEGTSPLTITTNPDRSFFDAGVFIWPNHPTFPRQVVLHNAVITTTDISDVEEDVAPSLPSLEIRFAPNPIHDRTWLELRSPAGDRSVDLEILDASGRQVQRWDVVTGGNGVTRWQWDATDRAGRALPTGTYFYRAHTGSATSSGKIQIVR